MTAREKVAHYVRTGWPVASRTLDGCLRKAYGASRIPNLGLIEFIDLLAAEGFRPQKYGIFFMFGSRGLRKHRLT